MEKKVIRLNAFDMNCVGHQSPGLWTHPDDRSATYNTLEYWTEVARVLERGKFDAIFLADVLGVYDVYRGNADAALANSIQLPVNDPTLVVPAMALVTEHLGFGLTGTLSYEPPYTFARRISTLDHLTNGRLAWNIVTGYLNSAAKGAGMEGQRAHDDRYAIAEEYMEVVYKLWEGSWEDDAVVRDKQGRLFTHPEKVRKVNHQGRHYRVDAYHLCEPSAQRTPVLYQAGASARGVAFAARHAECVFTLGPSKRVISDRVRELRKQVADIGRDPAELLVFTLATVIVAETDKAARAKYAEYKEFISYEGAAALVGGWTGIDFSKYSPDDPISHVHSDAIQSAVEAFTVADRDKVWTVREFVEFVGIGGLGPVIVGSPETVADELIGWVEDTDIDGFNLAYALSPGTFIDFVDYVVPELQRRGVYKTEYARGTLREKLYGGSAKLPEHHPAAAFRHRTEP
jgi:FMN-dependent oxidoreductase (nitrilotriacetate monooxygenase family)